MTPKKDYELIDTETARAFITLFINHGNLFKFPIDNYENEDEELRGYVIENDYEHHDGNSTINIVGINQTQKVEKLEKIMVDMGLDILHEEELNQYHESIGDYTSNVIVASATENVSAEWNVPHLLIYGSLSPEIEEACYAAFGDSYEYHNIRNHYVIKGNGLTKDDRLDLSKYINQGEGFEEDKKFNSSQASRAEYI